MLRPFHALPFRFVHANIGIILPSLPSPCPYPQTHLRAPALSHDAFLGNLRRVRLSALPSIPFPLLVVKFAYRSMAAAPLSTLISIPGMRLILSYAIFPPVFSIEGSPVGS